MTHEDWDKSFHHRCVAAFLNGDAIAAPDARGERVSDDSFLLCFNAHDQYVEFITPQNDYAHEWTVELDTNDPVGDADLVVAAEAQLKVPARSLIVLRKTG
jgi:glycogen operon protein